MEDAAKRREEQRLKRKVAVEEAQALRELLLQTQRKMAGVGQVAAGNPVSADDLAAWQSWNAPDHTASTASPGRYINTGQG